MALSCSHFGNPRLCFSLKMAELAYGLHYNLSPEPTKKTVKGWILKTLTHKDKKNQAENNNNNNISRDGKQMVGC